MLLFGYFYGGENNVFNTNISFNFYIFICIFLFNNGHLFKFNKKPAPFLFNKKNLKNEDISNLKMFNMAVSILWLIYAVSFMVIGLIAYYYNIKIASILLIIYIVAISPVLSYIYLIICNKYVKTEENIDKK